jgi:antitoxin component YwqK of YwqJK toxin-antitoxin module
MQPVVRRHKNSNNLIEEWHLDGKLHRVDGPALIEWLENGDKLSETWYLNGKIYRLDGPACTDWYKNGNKKSEE